MLKKMKSALLFLAIANVSFAQTSESPKKGSLIGFSGNLVDFTNAASSASKSNLNPGFSVMYWKGLTNHINLSLRYNGLFTSYVKNIATTPNQYTSEFEGSLHFNLLTDNHFFNPFLSGGLGIGNYGQKVWAPYAPVGVGLQFNLSSESYIFIQANERYSFNTNQLDNNAFYSLGVAGSLGHKRVEAPKVVLPPPPPVVADRDGDGVPDAEDKCPDVAGLAALHGCPDKDGDGIPDSEDKCPDVAGLAKYQGCPIPDTDKDGINDEEDKCPTVPGVARYQGCPIPDTDKDGVNDEEDKCPNEPGPASNFGCPVIAQAVIDKINYAAKNIFFATGSAKLLPQSFKSLNEVAKIMADDKSLKLDIDGHTDNAGDAAKNQTLSEARAAAVKAYLVSKGVDESKMVSAGHGSDMPAADNKTAAGRAKNRRVELKAKNY